MDDCPDEKYPRYGQRRHLFAHPGSTEGDVPKTKAVKMVHIEDAFFTGILAEAANVQRIDAEDHWVIGKMGNWQFVMRAFLEFKF